MLDPKFSTTFYLAERYINQRVSPQVQQHCVSMGGPKPVVHLAALFPGNDVDAADL